MVQIKPEYIVILFGLAYLWGIYVGYQLAQPSDKEKKDE